MSDYIFDQVQRCRKRLRSRNPYELLDSMGVVLVLSNAYQRDGLRGYCTIMNKIPFVMINQKQPEEYQRIVAAHEAAHLILHKAQLKVGAFREFEMFNMISRLELQANVFSADFLIDDEEVMDLMHSQDADCYAIARELYVPAQFLQIKLYSMSKRDCGIRIPTELNSSFLKSGGLHK